jgi:hypothetical protein
VPEVVRGEKRVFPSVELLCLIEDGRRRQAHAIEGRVVGGDPELLRVGGRVGQRGGDDTGRATWGLLFIRAAVVHERREGAGRRLEGRAEVERGGRRRRGMTRMTVQSGMGARAGGRRAHRVAVGAGVGRGRGRRDGGVQHLAVD